MEEKTTKNYKIENILPPEPKPTEEQIKVQAQEKEEQERTRVKKALFLQYMEKTRGVITFACEKTEIYRSTYYDWMKADPEFAAAVKATTANRNVEVEDLLMGKIFVEKDATSIRYYLDRKNPDYKPKVSNDVDFNDKFTSVKVEIVRTREEANNTNGTNGEDIENKGDDGIRPELPGNGENHSK